MTKTPFDVYSKRPAPDCGIGPTWPAFLTAKRAVLFALLLGSSALGGCATYIPPEISYDAEVPPLPATPVALDDRSRPLHIPPLWKPALGGKSGGKEDAEPVSRVETANSAARVEPRKRGYFNAAQIYAYSPGALYQITPRRGRSRISRSRKENF